MSASKTISFQLNGQPAEFAIAPGEMLVKVLRRNGYTGTKEGCDEGTCGACTVLIDGRAVLSCITPAFQASGRNVQTIEGVGDFNRLHPIQQALVNEGGVQCGYCTPGFVLATIALFAENPKPTDEDFKVHLDGNFCRCTGYEKMWTALKKVRDGQA